MLWSALAYLVWPWVEQAFPFSWPEKDFKMPDGTRSYYLYQPEKIPPNARLPLYIFLMGFDLVEQPSQDTRNNYRKMAKFAEKHQALIAFPRGMPGSFPENPEVRAWYPDHFRDNRVFLASLTVFLQQKLPIDPEKIVLMGFSNGGYFAGIEMLANPKTPYKGFWLDGGAYPYAFSQEVARKPVFLSYGENDQFNRPYIEKFRSFILDNGWQEGRNLKTFLHKKGHAFNDQSIDAGMEFFAAFFAAQE
jgi:predicted esterase